MFYMVNYIEHTISCHSLLRHNFIYFKMIREMIYLTFTENGNTVKSAGVDNLRFKTVVVAI